MNKYIKVTSSTTTPVYSTATKTMQQVTTCNAKNIRGISTAKKFYVRSKLIADHHTPLGQKNALGAKCWGLGEWVKVG